MAEAEPEQPHSAPQPYFTPLDAEEREELGRQGLDPNEYVAIVAPAAASQFGVGVAPNGEKLTVFAPIVNLPWAVLPLKQSSVVDPHTKQPRLADKNAIPQYPAMRVRIFVRRTALSEDVQREATRMLSLHAAAMGEPSVRPAMFDLAGFVAANRDSGSNGSVP